MVVPRRPQRLTMATVRRPRRSLRQTRTATPPPRRPPRMRMVPPLLGAHRARPLVATRPQPIPLARAAMAIWVVVAPRHPTAVVLRARAIRRLQISRIRPHSQLLHHDDWYRSALLIHNSRTGLQCGSSFLGTGSGGGQGGMSVHAITRYLAVVRGCVRASLCDAPCCHGEFLLLVPALKRRLTTRVPLCGTRQWLFVPTSACP